MDFKEIINNRRAVNFFDPQKKVPEKLLKEVIEMAAKAPSSFNLQPWNLIVLKEPEEKMRLQKLAWNQPKVSEAPVTLIISGATATDGKRDIQLLNIILMKWLNPAPCPRNSINGFWMPAKIFMVPTKKGSRPLLPRIRAFLPWR